MRHANISIFVPHLGCPCNCSFCNQNHITGTCFEPREDDIVTAVKTASKSRFFDPSITEIAFFGGSFTAIDRKYMISLLDTASSLVQDYGLYGIRISTRPDAIDDEVLSLLKSRNVTAIELGAQSMVDEVLISNDRGHTVNDVKKASSLIKKAGFELGLQMMTGLYRDTDENSIATAKEIINLRPDIVRIYPTVVLKGTRLEKLYVEGCYTPQTLDSAVSLCVKLQDMFDNAGINVIRTGLHSIEEDSYVAGPWHPAFNELCVSRRFLSILMSNCISGKKYNVYVNPSDVSKVTGQKKSNILLMKKNNVELKIIQDLSVLNNTLKIREVN